MTAERLDSLLRNDWERATSGRQATAEVAAILFLIIFVIAIVAFGILYSASPLPGIGVWEVSVGSALVAAALLTAGLLIVSRRGKKRLAVPEVTRSWYVSTVERPGLEREDFRALVRSLLVRHGYDWREKHSGGEKQAWVDLFEVVGIGAMIRVNGIAARKHAPFLEVNVGPETPENEEALEVLKREISTEAVRRFADAQGDPLSSPGPEVR